MRLSYSSLVWAMTTLLVVSSIWNYASSFSSDQNAIVGLAPNDCGATVNPQTTALFYSSMISQLTNGNQWSAQDNGYVYPNDWEGTGFSINFVQYNLAINSNGQVYGAVQIWAGAYGSVWNYNTAPLATVTHVNTNDEFFIDPVTDKSNAPAVIAVDFYYYESSIGKEFEQIATIPSGDATTLLAWQLNIVGENNGASNAQFTSGTGISYYLPDLNTNANWQSSIPSCAQTPYDITAETSNMAYHTPSISP
jgi:hypothetical protein